MGTERIERIRNMAEEQALGLFRTGLDMIPFTPNPDATDPEEAARWVRALLTKIEDLKPMLGA